MSSAYLSRHITLEEEQLYNHLLYWAELESPQQLIERFNALFIDGSRYPDTTIAEALDAVVAAKTATEEFRYVLNRCCHILINRWQSRSQFQSAIPELIQLFESAPTNTSSGARRSRSVRRLRELTKQFTATEQYVTLRRLAQVIQAAHEATGKVDHRPLGTLIGRYPYLYEHCLLSEDSTIEQHNTVRQIQADIQNQFEINLTHYVAYKVRRSQASAKPEQIRRSAIIQPVANPTLLDDRELSMAIKQYVGKVDQGRTYRDIAQHFQSHSQHISTFGEFKDDLYQYITSAIDPEYGKRKFNNQLHLQLKDLLLENDAKPLNDFLIVRTCTQLLNFLVVDQPKHPNHFVFIDLITNLGPVSTTGILLKLVLFCRKVKPALERKLSILFGHYESSTRATVHWLIYALENLNVALSTNFGKVDLSFLR